jgi:hypothetical protein
MKYSTPIFVQALLVAGALAAPKGRGVSARVEERSQRSRLSHVKLPATGTQEINGAQDGNRTNVDYSSNWSGAVLTAPPSGTTFTAVSAQFTVPTPKAVGGQAGASSAWVGIDGDTYQDAILQTGVDFNVDADGTTSFDAWYEWLPDYAHDFSGITIKAGDKISVSVVSSSSTSGTATIENLTNGDKVTKDLTSSSALGGQNAEWIVEDFESGGSLVTLDNFGTVTFTEATAGVSDGSSVGTDGADIIDIKQNNKVLTSVSVPSSSEVVVTYSG